MVRFKNYLQIKEGKYPIWVRVTVGGLVLKIKNLSKQIETETDLKKQNILISKQNNLLSYITGLSVGVGSSDKALLRRMKKGVK